MIPYNFHFSIYRTRICITISKKYTSKSIVPCNSVRPEEYILKEDLEAGSPGAKLLIEIL